MVRTLDLSPWAGRSVAVDSSGRVQRHEPTLAELLDSLAATGTGEIEIMRAPAPDEPVDVGIG